MSQFWQLFEINGGDVKGVMDRFCEDKDLFKECLAQFVEDNQVSELKKRIEEQDYNNAFESAHALKGLVGNLGIQPFYMALCELVEILRGDQFEGAPEQLKVVVAEYERFLEVYRKMREV